jgi:hypothetical protein
MSIVVTCRCGRQLRAPDEHAGKQVKCPACGAPLTIPLTTATPGAAPQQPSQAAGQAAGGSVSIAPAPAQAAPAYGPPSVRPVVGGGATPVMRAGGIACLVFGIVMLGTIVIPWAISPPAGVPGGPVVVMSWDILNAAFGSADGEPGALVGVWVLMHWIAGGAAVVVVPVVRQARLRGTALMAIGGIAGLFTVALVFYVFAAAAGTPGLELVGSQALSGVVFLALTVMLVGCHLRRRFRESRPVAMMAAITGGTLGLSAALGLILGLNRGGILSAFQGNVPPAIRVVAVIALLGTLMFIVSGVVSVISLARPLRGHVIHSLGLGYGGIGVQAAAMLLLPLVQPLGAGLTLGFFNAMALGAGGFVLLGNGAFLVGAQALAARRLRSAAPA